MLLMDSWFRFEMPEGYRSYCPMKQNLFLGVPPRLITSNMIKLLLFFHTFPWGGKRLFCRIAADVELCLEILNDSNLIVLPVKKKIGVCYRKPFSHWVGRFIQCLQATSIMIVDFFGQNNPSNLKIERETKLLQKEIPKRCNKNKLLTMTRVNCTLTASNSIQACLFLYLICPENRWPLSSKIMTGSSFTKQSASFSCVSQFSNPLNCSCFVGEHLLEISIHFTVKAMFFTL